MTFKKTFLLGSIFALTLGGCDSGGSSSSGDKVNQPGDGVYVGPQDDVTLEIFSWWTEGAEQNALQAMLDVHEEQYPNATIVNAAAASAGDARQILEDRMAEGNPPSTFQDNTGSKILKWALFNGEDDSDTKLESLNDLQDILNWKDNMNQGVLDLNRVGDQLYAIPVNIHRQNNMYYNKAIMDSENLDVPTSPADLKDLADTLVTLGYEHPFCVGNKWGWTMDFFVFEGLVPAMYGADYHNSFWAGKEQPDDQKIVDALQYALDIWPMFNPDSGELTYSEGIDKMVDLDPVKDAADVCVMTMMGDWAKGHLEEKGWEGEKDFLQRPFPGAEKIYVFSGDSFPIPKGAPDIDSTKALLATFGSAEGQTAFNKLKGSIPARTDINPEEFDVTTQRQIADFTNPKNDIVGSYRVITPAGSFPEIGPSVKDMLTDGDIDVALRDLKNEYPEIQQ